MKGVARRGEGAQDAADRQRHQQRQWLSLFQFQYLSYLGEADGSKIRAGKKKDDNAQ